MEIITVGKPATNIYINLAEYPMEGDVFRINKKVESVGNASATSAVLLAKWGYHVNFCGSIGQDGYAEKVQNVFKEYKINTKYLETDYEGGSAVNHLIINNKTKSITKILYSSDTSALKRFKFDFTPDWAVFDGTDIPATLGVINTNPGLHSVFYLNTINKEINNIAKKCDWIVVNQNYILNLTKAQLDGSAEAYVSMYQQLVDINGQSNYIVLLNNHKILYSEDGKVKMLPDLQFNNEDSSSFESIFTGAFTFAISLGLTLDDSIKFANTATALGLGKIGEVEAIPDIKEVIDNSGFGEKIEEAKVKLKAAEAAAEQARMEQAMGKKATPVKPVQQPSATAIVAPTQPVTQTANQTTAPVTQTVNVTVAPAQENTNV